MDDVNTRRLAEMLSIANRLTELGHDVNRLLLSSEADAGALRRLAVLLRRAEERADAIRSDIAKNLWVAAARKDDTKGDANDQD